MTDRNFVLRWAHLGRGRPRSLRHRQIIDEQRRIFDAHVAEIWAEQEGKNKVLAARAINSTRLEVDPRYAKDIAHRLRSRGVGHDSVTSARDEAE